VAVPVRRQTDTACSRVDPHGAVWGEVCPQWLCYGRVLLVQSVLHVVATVISSSSPSSSASLPPAAAAAAGGAGRIAPSMRRREFYCEEIDQRTKVCSSSVYISHLSSSNLAWPRFGWPNFIRSVQLSRDWISRSEVKVRVMARLRFQFEMWSVGPRSSIEDSWLFCSNSAVERTLIFSIVSYRVTNGRYEPTSWDALHGRSLISTTVLCCCCWQVALHEPLTTKELVDSARSHVFHVFYFILLILAAMFICILTQRDLPISWILPAVAVISLITFYHLKLWSLRWGGHNYGSKVGKLPVVS